MLLHRAHEADPIPQLDVRRRRRDPALALSRRWLDARPLLAADLLGEPEDMQNLGIALVVESD